MNIITIVIIKPDNVLKFRWPETKILGVPDKRSKLYINDLGSNLDI